MSSSSYRKASFRIDDILSAGDRNQNGSRLRNGMTEDGSSNSCVQISSNKLTNGLAVRFKNRNIQKHSNNLEDGVTVNSVNSNIQINSNSSADGVTVGSINSNIQINSNSLADGVTVGSINSNIQINSNNARRGMTVYPTSSDFQTNSKVNSTLLKSGLYEHNSFDLLLQEPKRPTASYTKGPGYFQKPPVYDCPPFCLPLTMPMQHTTFHPYLDHYANTAMHKAASRYWPVYPQSPGYGGYGPCLRPFSGAPHYSNKRKGGQVRFTPQQTQSLEKQFYSHKYLSPEDRRLLACQLKLSDRQVKTWFQNRRAKWRRANHVIADECEDSQSDDMSTTRTTESDAVTNRADRNSSMLVS